MTYGSGSSGSSTGSETGSNINQNWDTPLSELKNKLTGEQDYILVTQNSGKTEIYSNKSKDEGSAFVSDISSDIQSVFEDEHSGS
jgi:hypothetical protein